MGKQMNYWLGYEDFLQIAQTALDCGCVIMKNVSGRWSYGQTPELITEWEHDYWFYVPEAGSLSGITLPFEDGDMRVYSAEGNTVIEAGFSYKKDGSREITRSRLFVISGYYDEQGEYVPRPECVTKIYQRLVRAAKKAAPLTELTDTYTSVKEDSYLQVKERIHKEYISPQFLLLKLNENYRLTV